MSSRDEHIGHEIIEAFWDAPGDNRDGVIAVARLLVEHCAKIADDLCEEAPSGSSDNGGTQDGWRMACTKLAQKYRELFTSNGKI